MVSPFKILNNRYRATVQPFLDGLVAWGRTGKEPPEGTEAVRRFLELKEHRLKRHGISEELSFPYRIDATHEIALPDNVWMSGTPVRLRHVLRRQGKVCHRRSQGLYFRSFVLDAGEGPGFKDELHNCPNCGAINTLDQLSLTGCAYCGARYEMSELFPKIMNYYFSEDIGKQSFAFMHLKKLIVGGGIAFSLVGLLVAHLVSPQTPGMIETIFAGLILFLIGAAIAFLLLNMGMVLYVLGKAVGSIFGGVKIIYNKDKLRRYLNKVDPDFSHEYIEAKAVTLLQQVVFSEDATALTVYRGAPLGGRFRDILDLNYLGSFGLVKGETRDGDYLMTLEVPMRALVLKGRRIVSRKKKFRLTLAHRQGVPIRYNFSIHLVHCNSCGASFDAYRERHCTYCGSEYEPQREDWAVVAVTDGKR